MVLRNLTNSCVNLRCYIATLNPGFIPLRVVFQSIWAVLERSCWVLAVIYIYDSALAAMSAAGKSCSFHPLRPMVVSTKNSFIAVPAGPLKKASTRPPWLRQSQRRRGRRRSTTRFRAFFVVVPSAQSRSHRVLVHNMLQIVPGFP